MQEREWKVQQPQKRHHASHCLPTHGDSMSEPSLHSAIVTMRGLQAACWPHGVKHLVPPVPCFSSRDQVNALCIQQLQICSLPAWGLDCEQASEKCTKIQLHKLGQIREDGLWDSPSLHSSV